MNLPHFSCGPEDSTPQLASAPGKEGALSDQRIEDHAELVAVAPNTALEVVRRKGESALFKEERRGSSPMRQMSMSAIEEKIVEVC